MNHLRLADSLTSGHRLNFAYLNDFCLFALALESPGLRVSFLLESGTIIFLSYATYAFLKVSEPVTSRIALAIAKRAA